MYYQAFYPYQPFPEENEYSRNVKENQKYFSVEEGFLAGNIFKNEYMPFKNYQIPKLNPKNEQESKLFNLMAYYNYRHDLNLMLDVYPTNKELLSMFMEINEKYKKVLEEYVKQYGPLGLENATEENGMFNYVTTPSPWLSR